MPLAPPLKGLRHFPLVRGTNWRRLEPMSEPKLVPLNRETIRSGAIRDLIRQHGQVYKVMTDDELTASRHSLFAGAAPTADVWLFGYGSLIWNPAIEFAERLTATAHGYHRRFCLETKLGRGAPDCPGLMLGLDRGGSCRGVAYRIPGDIAERELDIVWRREMVSNAYIPRWLRLATEQGPVRAIGFVMNRRHERYIGAIPDDDAARIIERATGFLGPCADYLFNTVRHLEELGIPDRGLARLTQKVRQLREAREGGR